MIIRNRTATSPIHPLAAYLHLFVVTWGDYSAFLAVSTIDGLCGTEYSVHFCSIPLTFLTIPKSDIPLKVNLFLFKFPSYVCCHRQGG